jgi:general secretion pathway protein B
MSFILDALRKSETERQRQATPSLADAQYHVNKKKRSFWVPLLAAILAANLLILAYVLINESDDVGDPPQVPAAPAAGMAERSRIAPVQRNIQPVEMPVRKPLVAEPPLAPTAAAVVEEPTPAPEYASDAMNLPSMQQLVSIGQLSLSPLHVDIHVYAGQPEKRFIFINMNKYREGDLLDEGPTVDEITETGVILSHQGNRFTLDRE